MMKARKYNRRILNGAVKPNVLAIQDSGFITDDFIAYVAEKDTRMKADLTLLRSSLKDAKEYGSILHMPKLNFAALYERIDIISRSFAEDMFQISYQNTAVEQLLPLVKQAEIMAQKYDVVVTNPPYMGGSGMSNNLADFVKKNYPDSKSDLFAVFIEKCGTMLKKNGYQAMITQQAWMFTALYEELRNKLSVKSVCNLLQFGSRGFDGIGGEVVQTAAFVIRNCHTLGFRGSYMDLTEGSSEASKEEIFHSRTKLYTAIYSDFGSVPNSSMAYWLSHEALVCFGKNKLSTGATTREGMTTADNDRFLRNWHEIVFSKISTTSACVADAVSSSCKWFPYNKGGSNRKWYGNNDLVVNWENDGFEIKNLKDPKTGRIRSHNYNAEYSFRESGTWTAICSGDIMVRYSRPGALFDSKGASVFASTPEKLMYVIGMLNSKVSGVFLKVLSPAYEYKVGHVANVPMLIDSTDQVEAIVSNCIDLAQQDWDADETSWDFKKHPLV